MVASSMDTVPWYFSKYDIKDGYYRLRVETDDEWKFAYVLSKLIAKKDIKETEIVVPGSLKMGWSKSPPYFCAASETVRDIADDLSIQMVGSLPDNPL